MELKVEIETNDPHLLFDIFGARELRAGESEITISKGISLVYNGTIVRLATGLPNIVQFILKISGPFASDIVGGLVGSFLYDILRGKVIPRIRIDNIEVSLNKNEIKRIVIEILEKLKGN